MEQEPKYLTIGQVVEQLLKLNQNAHLTINIKQANKVYGRQVYIHDSPDAHGSQFWVNGAYGGSITVHLPEKAIISNWPKDKL